MISLPRKELSVRIPIEPYGAAAHDGRAVPTGRRNKRGEMIYSVQTYMRPKYRAWREEALPFFQMQRPSEPFDGPLEVHILACSPFREGDRRKTRFVPRAWADTKPDLDNILKASMDCAAAAGWMVNDSRIARFVAEHCRAGQDEEPFLYVKMLTLEVPFHQR